MSITLQELQEQIGDENHERGWHERWYSLFTNESEVDHIAAKLALVHSEISEALEELRNGHHYTETYYNGDKPEGFPIELADAVIRILDLAYMLGFDLEEFIKIKLKYNATRGHKHGGKVL